MSAIHPLQGMRWPDDGLRGVRREFLSWWWGLPEVLRSKAWPTAFACLTILGLLLGFHQVVAMSVKQGELLRMTTATRAEAVWRCNSLRNPALRASCREQLDGSQQAQAPTPVNAVHVAQR